MTEELVENSHLLYGLRGEEREDTKTQILEIMREQFYKIQDKFVEYEDYVEVAKINQNEEPFKTLNQNYERMLREQDDQER